MIKTPSLLFSLALCCLSAAPLRAAAFRSHAAPRYASIAAGTRCRIPRGAFIAVSEEALQRTFQAAGRGDHAALIGLIQRNEVEKLIRDANGVVLGTRGNAVEVQIPGLIGTVVTPRETLIAR
jgi:hypothetical protein